MLRQTASFHALPPALQADLARVWEAFSAAAPAPLLAALRQRESLWQSLARVWGCSTFISKSCVQQPQLLQDLLDSGDLERGYGEADWDLRVAAELAGVDDEAALLRGLRRLRRREMVRIAWRDLAGWAELAESLRDLSDLADAAVRHALAHAERDLLPRFGTPCDAEGEPQGLVVLGMGKLGGRELNFSSDIDLIFSYPSDGETRGGSRSYSNQEYFVRLGQKLIHALNSVTAEGFVFRVDMRLRPFGDSGPLAMSFEAMEEYYQAHAREWERYALIKARAITGGEAGARLLGALRPFIYRRYLDYGAFESLRDLKQQIDREVRRKGHDDNLKLGPGGIREVEFVCQVFQLIRGGRQPDLQSRHLLDTLRRLLQYQLLPPQTVAELGAAYEFLRLSENRLQAMEDRQTQNLPPDPIERSRLAHSMGCADWEAYLAALQPHRERVHRCFRGVISDKETASVPAERQGLVQLWETDLSEADALAALGESGFGQPETALEALRQLREAPALRRMSREGRQRLDRFVPLLLAVLADSPQRDLALPRLLRLVEAVARRSVYLALLLEHPAALTQLVRLCADSAWAAEQIIHYPLLLDEMLDPRRLYDPLKPEQLDNAVQAQLAHLPLDDLEAQMDTLRQFKRAQVLHVASAELSGNLSVEVSSDYLTAIADSLLRQTLAVAWNDLSRKHGQPRCRDAEEGRAARFAIIAYGKAGGIEMSYSSDLDVVFLHDSQGEDQATDGEKSIDNNVFFARLAKRIIHLLSTQTSGGVLYEVDQRLRPGGNSGLLVSSLGAFRDYQQNQAWTWEHQALVRARGVAGDPACLQAFETIRGEILQRPRDAAKLSEEVQDMRQKMRQSLDKSDAGGFDLKQGEGGIADIEFIVQYGVLRWAGSHPELLETTGMLPMLRRFERNGLYPPQVCADLSAAYRAYRAETHRLALQNQPARVPAETFADLRRSVRSAWQQIFAQG